MGFAEDKMFDYLRNNLNTMKYVNVDDLLNQLRGVFTDSIGEELERSLDRRGNQRTLYQFLRDLRGRDNWVNHLLMALWNCEHHELFHKLQAEYRSHRPRTVWEPDLPPHSLPASPPNYNGLPPDSPPHYASLPIQAHTIYPEPKPDAPVAPPAPSPVRPEQGSNINHQPQESRHPPALPDPPVPRRAPPAMVPVQPVSLPDVVDAGPPVDDISKAPVPESSPYPPQQEIKETDPTEQTSSVESSLPVKMHMVQTLQERPANQEVIYPVEQRIAVVNTLKKEGDKEVPRTSLDKEETDPTEQTSSVESSLPVKKEMVQTLQERPANREVIYPVEQRIPVVNTARAATSVEEVSASGVSSASESYTSGTNGIGIARIQPLQRTQPGSTQSTYNPPIVKYFDTNDTKKYQAVAPSPNLVMKSPSQRQSESGANAGANAGDNAGANAGAIAGANAGAIAGANARDNAGAIARANAGASAGASAGGAHQGSRPPGAQNSSCRPTDDDATWGLSKPGVLSSNAELADITGETGEVSPLSTPPVLEISDDESSNPQSSDSFNPPASGTSKKRQGSQEVPTTSTPTKVYSRSSPKKSPEENEEPGGVSSSVHGRRLNPSLTQEPQESSFELSRDLSYYRLEFSESPSMDNMAENAAPPRTANTSGTTENTTGRAENTTGRAENTTGRAENTTGRAENTDRAASTEENISRESHLHNPVVITLSAAVVCLSLYIIWLKK